jgi:hypothetical protein
MEKQENQCPQLNSLEEFEFLKTAVIAGNMSIGEMIALKPIVENLGLDWSGQLKRLKREDPNNQLWTYQKSPSVDQKSYDMVCMSPVNIQNWLYGFQLSNNLNVSLLEDYKKGLVVHLLMMLKISLEEVQRLRGIEQEFQSIKCLVYEFVKETDDGQYHNALSKEKFRSAKNLKTALYDRLNNHNGDQTKLF